MLSSETKNQFKSKSRQKKPLAPVKASWIRMYTPGAQQISLCRATVLLLRGHVTHVHCKHRSISQWNLNKVKWRTLYKKGCRQFHPNNTSSKERRNSKESLSLFYPSHHFLVFNLPTFVTERCTFHPFLRILGKQPMKKVPFVGRGASSCQTSFSLTNSQGKPSCGMSSPLLLAEFRSADGLPSLSNRITFHLIGIFPNTHVCILLTKFHHMKLN